MQKRNEKRIHTLLEAVLVFIVLGLVEQEVGRQLLVLVAREVRLHGRLTAESEPAELNGKFTVSIFRCP